MIQCKLLSFIIYIFIEIEEKNSYQFVPLMVRFSFIEELEPNKS